MGCKFTQLQCKEVICLADGQRLGFISDVVVALPCGQVEAIVVPGPCRILGIAGRQDDYIIPFECIRQIGPDIVLVDICPDKCRTPRAKSALPF